MRLLIFLSFLFVLEAAHAVTIEKIDCNKPLTSAPVYTVLSDERNTLDGWSHIRFDAENDEFGALKLTESDYAISRSNHRPDSTCNEIKVQQAVLTVKLSDWTRQHANGFETLLEVDDVRFKDVSHVLIDLRLNRSKTHIPSSESLSELYRDVASSQQLKELDDATASFAITLFQEGALNQSSKSLNAEFLFEVDQDKYFDQWLRVVAPSDDFDFYMEQEYARTPVSKSALGQTILKGFRFNLETTKGNQLRNLLGSKWQDSLPENFKEVSVSIRRIEFLSSFDKKNSSEETSDN